MKLPEMELKRSDMIMFALFLTVVCGLMSKGMLSIAYKSLTPEFLEQKKGSKDFIA